ncbi:uncharacterized protein LOC144917911 [Branchiostoma floridae x Branchiostoma belcheri]
MASVRTTFPPQPPVLTTNLPRQQEIEPEPAPSSEALDLPAAASCWASLGAHGLFSRDRPLPRRYFSRKTARSLDDFDSMHMILAKCTITPPWVDYIQPDGSLFFIEASAAVQERHQAENKRSASIRPQSSTRSENGKENRQTNKKSEGGSAKLLKKLEMRRNKKNKGQSNKRNQKNRVTDSPWKNNSVLPEKSVCRLVKHEIITRAVTAASMCFR